MNLSKDNRATLCPDGKYRWVYEVSMLKNPSILTDVFKVLGISIGIVWLFMVAITACDGNLGLESLWFQTRLFLLILLLMMALGVVAHVIVAWTYDWSYWFDSDVKGVKTTDIASGATTIDAAALVEGIHTIHYQVVDNHGVAGIPVSRMFMKVSAKTITATAIQYWFDENDALIKESAITNLSTTIDASSVGQGEHTLHYQLKFSDGTLSPSSSATFETTQTLEGDANNDQKVNVADIVVIQVFVDDNTKSIHGANADVTGDGIIDKNDIEAVKDMIITPKE